jgi:hypothetical protein
MLTRDPSHVLQYDRELYGTETSPLAGLEVPLTLTPDLATTLQLLLVEIAPQVTQSRITPIIIN